MKMTFLHSEVLDIRARARQLSKLLTWEEEGTVVDPWIENCSMQKKPSRLALGRYLKRIWQRELEGQKALKQSKPTIEYKWQPPGPDLYRFVVGFLEEMEANVAFPRWKTGALTSSRSHSRWASN
jgi:hypothetical protein